MAEALHRKAGVTLAPLAREMALMGWKPEFRAILWMAVAREAERLAAEAEGDNS